jgi:hypothetical protein
LDATDIYSVTVRALGLLSGSTVWGLAVLETVETVGRDDDGGQRRRKVNDGVIIQRHPVCHFGHRKNKKKRKKKF